MVVECRASAAGLCGTNNEIGTPFCVTVDFDSLEDDSVTVRDRDEMTQQRIPIGGVADHLAKTLKGC